jgi:hypothetical protein
MNSSQLSEDDFDDELYKHFMKLSKISKISDKELKEVKQEKESVVIQLSESHA